MYIYLLFSSSLLFIECIHQTASCRRTHECIEYEYAYENRCNDPDPFFILSLAMHYYYDYTNQNKQNNTLNACKAERERERTRPMKDDGFYSFRIIFFGPNSSLCCVSLTWRVLHMHMPMNIEYNKMK